MTKAEASNQLNKIPHAVIRSVKTSQVAGIANEDAAHLIEQVGDGEDNRAPAEMLLKRKVSDGSPK